MKRASLMVVLVLGSACSGAAPPRATPAGGGEPASGDPSESAASVAAAEEPTPEVVAPAPSTLVADFAAPFWSRLQATAVGPNHLAAFAERRRVTIVDLEAREVRGVLELAPDPDRGIPLMARQIRSLGFIGGDRLAIGTHGIEVVDLHDITQREEVEVSADSAAAFAATDEGMIVVMASGEVIRFEGRPLRATERWRLPTYPSAGLNPTLARVGDRIFVTSQNQLFSIDGRRVTPVTLPGEVGPRARVMGSWSSPSTAGAC